MSLACSYFENEKCRSCSLLAHASDAEHSYPQKLYEAREADIKEALAPVTKASTLWHPLCSLENPFQSRSKARLAVSGTSSSPVIGLLDSEFSGIELENCPLHLPLINRIVHALPDFIKHYSLTPYDVQARSGELKYVIVQSNAMEREAMLRFILRSTEAVPRITKGFGELQERFPELQVVSANIQPIPHQIPEGDEEIILSKRESITETYNNIRFEVGPQAFTQVTPRIAERLYAFAEDKCTQYNSKQVLDCYSGIGAFSLHAARTGARVTGFEISANAVRLASNAAERNQAHGVTFTQCDLHNESLNTATVDTIICNPPRRGLSQKLLSHIKSSAASTLLYSSCNVQTLAQDLLSLAEEFLVTEVASFDMFPLTKHAEILAVCRRA